MHEITNIMEALDEIIESMEANAKETSPTALIEP